MTHAHSHDHAPGHPGALADLLDLDATVLHASWADITAWVRRLCDGIPHRRILDLGAGTGNGTVALAQRFLGAEVVALDVSAEMLDRVRRRALDLGLAGRVRTLHADLDADWPALDPVDLAWASMSLHEVADPDRVLADVRATLHPGGLLALVEIDGPVRFLADDGLESRLLSFPHHQQDWGLRLEQAGLEVVETRTFDVGMTPPAPAQRRPLRARLVQPPEVVARRHPEPAGRCAARRAHRPARSGLGAAPRRPGRAGDPHRLGRAPALAVVRSG